MRTQRNDDCPHPTTAERREGSGVIAALAIALILVLAAGLWGVAQGAVTNERWQLTLIRGSTTLEQVGAPTQAEVWERCANRIKTISDTANPTTVFACQTLRFYATTAAKPTNTATLTWKPPTQNTDGSTLSDLAGYRLSYGQSPDALTQIIQIPSPATTSYIAQGLASGTWYFVIRAYTSGGTESALSNSVSKVIQ